MNNIEKIFKREFGNMKQELVDFKSEIKGEIIEVKKGIIETKKGIIEAKKGIIEAKKDIIEVKNEIRERFFCFEQDYGREIDAIYDKVILDRQISDKRINEIEEKIKTNDTRILRNYASINELEKSKKNNSK